MMIYPVPEIFQVPDMFYYPEDNWPDFEYWFMKNTTEDELKYQGRVYLPILFTSYFKRNQFGKNKASIGCLQRFVDTLPVDKKYFAIVQFDDGVLIDWRGKDVVVFGMSGKPDGCIPIPLVCQPHKHRLNVSYKDIMCSFVGRDTGFIRNGILNSEQRPGWYISSRHHPMDEYCQILARSRYVLCPRGYGASSFRVAEAFQYGAEPIIILKAGDPSYEHRLPIRIYDITEFKEKLLDDIYFDIYGKDSMKPMECLDIYNQHYRFESVKKHILQSLWAYIL